MDAADLVNIAKAFRNQQRRLRAGALQQGVDADRRAVEEEIRILDLHLGAGQRTLNAFGQRVVGRKRLAERQDRALLVESGEIGESAADIDGDAQAVFRGHKCKSLSAARVSW